MKKILCAFLVLSLAISLFSCQVKTRSRTVSGEYFHTQSVISTYADTTDKKIESYVSIADQVLSHYHKLFHIYEDFEGVNNIKTINDHAGKSPVKVEVEMIDFLEYCKELYTITGGKTNVMLGSVLKIWHECREEADDNFGYLPPESLPDNEALRAASAHTSIDDLIIDRESSTVYIRDAEASLDVGAIAKGYVVDLLYERLRLAGANATVLNVGGNIRTIGEKPDKTPWVSAIRNPDITSDEPFAVRIQIGEVSIVTSGDYERFFISGTEEYHHIIDPETLRPARYFSSVSICCRNSALGDALSTALFCMSYEDGAALVNSLVQQGHFLEVLWIDPEGRMQMTDGFASMICE